MINPILASSARRRMRQFRTPLLVTLYALLMLAVTLPMMLSLGQSTLSVSSMAISGNTYIALTIVQFALLLLIAPATTSGCISGERERQTLELLLVTNTGALRIVLGKLLDNFGFICLLLCTSLPSMCVSLLLGGVTLLQALCTLLFLMTSALALCAVGVFASSLCKRTVSATVCAYLLVFLIGIVTLLPLFWDVSRLAALLEAQYAQNNYNAADIGVFTPSAFILNPLLGLLSLIISQTGRLQTLFMGLSHTLSTGMPAFDFGSLALYSACFMLACAALLTALAAALVRPRGKASSK